MYYRDVLKAIYHDYFNNYLSLAVFAEHNGITTDQATRLITLAKEIDQSCHPDE